MTINPKLRVLIADDDEGIVQILFDYLKEYADDLIGKIVKVYNGKDALYDSLIEEYDLILIDLEMPYVKGGEVIQHIRTPGGFNELTPIIIVTGYLNTYNEKYPSVYSIEKPIDFNSLIKIIHDISPKKRAVD